MAKRRPKTRVIEAAGVRVRIFLRGEFYWLDVRRGTRRERISAKTTVAAQAERHAVALAEAIARQQLLGVTTSTLTLEQLFTSYWTHKGSALSGQWQRQAEAHRRDFIAVWGADCAVVEISQSKVDAYCRSRREAYAAAREGAGLRDGALECDFRWLSSVMNWARRHKLPTGARLVHENPLADCKWPREKNVRRPVASAERYEKTLAETSAIDPTGRLRLSLAFARYTGHRVDAILSLHVSDVLRTEADVRAALEASGMNPDDARHMPHGAVLWRPESDKMDLLHIAPISAPMRAELDLYLATLPRIGAAPLFPAGRSPDGRLSRHTANKWLVKAERRAGLGKLTGGLWHPYRRLWATQRKHLPDVDVAQAGGWKGTKAMKLAYQQSTADGVLAAVVA